LSGAPSQSLSALERQSRARGSTAPVHSVYFEFTQVLVPFLQMPRSTGGPHFTSTPSTHSQPEFGVPSQFASSPSTTQLSVAAGPSDPVQAPQWLVFPSAESSQLREPALQLPTPPSPGCVSQGSDVPGTHSHV